MLFKRHPWHETLTQKTTPATGVGTHEVGTHEVGTPTGVGTQSRTGTHEVPVRRFEPELLQILDARDVQVTRAGSRNTVDIAPVRGTSRVRDALVLLLSLGVAILDSTACQNGLAHVKSP